MTTTIHLPPDLLAKVDQRAEALGISRNRYIRTALEESLQSRSAWDQAFLAALRQAGQDAHQADAVDEMMKAIGARSSRKKAPRL